MRKDKKESGFGVLEVLLVLILFVGVGLVFSINYSLHHKKPKINASTGFHDNAECAGFTNYAVDRFKLPADFQLKVRSYVNCGNPAKLTPTDSSTQDMELAYRGPDYNSLDDFKSSLINLLKKNSWNYDPNQEKGNTQKDLFYLTRPNLGVRVQLLSYKPAFLTASISSTSAYGVYLSRRTSSPTQVYASLSDQLRDVPYGIYVPTFLPYLTPQPVVNIKDHTNIISRGYLTFYYNDNGLLINYLSSQIKNAKTNCYDFDKPCEVWGTTPNGTVVYIFPYIDDKTTLYRAFFDIGGTSIDMQIDPVNKKTISKDQTMQVIDSMQKVK